jgi:hypothetical protein
MVRPEPDKALGETNFGGQRSVKSRPRIIEIELLRHAGDGSGARRGLLGRTPGRRRWRGPAAALSPGNRPFVLARGALRPSVLEGSTGGRCAAREARVGHASSVCPIQLGEQRRTWIRGDSINRARAGTHAESAQGHGSGCFGIKGHAPVSFRVGPGSTPSGDKLNPILAFCHADVAPMPAKPRPATLARSGPRDDKLEDTLPDRTACMPNRYSP